MDKVEKENNFDNFKKDKATEITIPTIIDGKRVHFIARHLFRSSKHCHCTYVEFMKLDFPFFDYPKKLSGENNFHYSLSEFIDKLEGHSYCSYYDESEVSGGIKVKIGSYYDESEVNGGIKAKIGWDYSHYHDEEYTKTNWLSHIAEFDLRTLYDSFVDLNNEYKEKQGK